MLDSNLHIAPDPLVHELAAALKAVEWVDSVSDWGMQESIWHCPVCYPQSKEKYQEGMAVKGTPEKKHAADCPRQLALARYAAEYPEQEADDAPRPAVSATFTVPEGVAAAALLLALAEFAEAQGVVDFALSPDPEGSDAPA